MMGRNDEIAAFWGDKLVKVPAEKLAELALPKETRIFLEKVGLPIDERLRTYWIPGYQFAPDNLHKIKFEGHHYAVIGAVRNRLDEDLQWPLGLSEKTGEVFVLDTEGIVETGPTVEFINTNI